MSHGMILFMSTQRKLSEKMTAQVNCSKLYPNQSQSNQKKKKKVTNLTSQVSSCHSQIVNVEACRGVCECVFVRELLSTIKGT